MVCKLKWRINSDLGRKLDWLLPQHRHGYTAPSQSSNEDLYTNTNYHDSVSQTSGTTDPWPGNDDAHKGDIVRPPSIAVSFWMRINPTTVRVSIKDYDGTPLGEDLVVHWGSYLSYSGFPDHADHSDLKLTADGWSVPEGTFITADMTVYATYTYKVIVYPAYMNTAGTVVHNNSSYGSIDPPINGSFSTIDSQLVLTGTIKNTASSNRELNKVQVQDGGTGAWRDWDVSRDGDGTITRSGLTVSITVKKKTANYRFVFADAT